MGQQSEWHDEDTELAGEVKQNLAETIEELSEKANEEEGLFRQIKQESDNALSDLTPASVEKLQSALADLVPQLQENQWACDLLDRIDKELERLI